MTYEPFFSSVTAGQWKRIGIQRRAGVAAPLFSVYSENSAGIGEIPDLNLLVDWCVKTGLSIVQLLPMNDTGFNFTPYDACSTFALDPMYLSLENLEGAGSPALRSKIKDLKVKFPCGAERVNYGIKKAKLELLKEISSRDSSPGLQKFVEANRAWLDDYALFKVLKQKHEQAYWGTWPDKLKNREPQALSEIQKEFASEIHFEQWLQWQLYEQFLKTKKYAASRNVLLMGDLPFLVSKDSADVWAHQDYFKLDRIAGAPPDAFFAKGQRWGMPPYHWEKIASHDFEYLKQRLRYAENFYDFFRVDHSVGTFRLWTIALNEPVESAGLNGVFDPSDENQWEGHGRWILSAMIQNTQMLPCAEDLGVVPPASYKVLEEFAVPGMDVQRWAKDWDTTGDFKPPERYRKNSVAVLSTHDTTSFGGWWEEEAGTVDAEMFERMCAPKGVPFEELKEKLFDLKNSRHGRLRWRAEISSIGMLCQIFQKPEWEIQDIIGLHRGSYDEKQRFWHYAGLEGAAPEKSGRMLLKAALRKGSEAASVFSIQLLQDWLGFAGILPENPWEFRINFPGTMGPRNWTLVMPLSLEKLNALKENADIRKLNEETGRSQS